VTAPVAKRNAYLKQLETESRIWFRDARKSSNHCPAFSAHRRRSQGEVVSQKLGVPAVSPFAGQRIWPFRTMFMASYPAIVLSAPSTDQNHWLATTRFFTKR
jgi:hypothetical protein